MTGPIEQALAAVDLKELRRVVESSRCVDADQWAYSDLHTLLRPSVLDAILNALQSAAQEQKDWKAIEDWSVEYKNRTYELVHTPSADDESKAYCVALTGRMLREIVEAPTRLAALSKAAAFCRRELEK